MTDTTKRDAAALVVLDEYRKTWAKPPVLGVTRGVVGHDGLAMAAEVVLLRAILAALREPSEAVIRMVSHFAYSGHGYRMPDDVLAALIRVAVDEAEQQPVSERAAVTAAEQGVDRA